MRVPGDDGVKTGGRRVEVELAEIVNDIESSLADLNYLAGPKTGCPGTFIVVSANRHNGGNGLEPFQHRKRADVARVDDEFRTRECCNRFGSEQTVGIGDNADSLGYRSHRWFPTLLTLLPEARPLQGDLSIRWSPAASVHGLTAIICNSTRAPAFSAATCTVALAGGSFGKNSL